MNIPIIFINFGSGNSPNRIYLWNSFIIIFGIIVCSAALFPTSGATGLR